MEYLLMIHIGPVQDFIATARRSKDLWFGSWLLSELSKAAAQSVVKHENNNLDSLIFPAPASIDELNPNSDLNVANKIIAVVSQPPSLDAKDDYVQQAVWARLREIRRQAYKFVNGSYNKEIAKSQVDDFLEYFWVAAPIKSGQYAAAREQAEALMMSRKFTRNFNQVGWGASIPKSSLDGIRESVIPEAVYPNRGDSDEERQTKTDKLFSDYGAKSAERLSGVDLLKRHGFRGHISGFPSTSHIASLPLRTHLKDRQELKTDWQAYHAVFPKDFTNQERVPPPFASHPIFEASDGSLLFESRLSEYLTEPTLSKAKEQLRKFLKKAADGQEPTPYYALLLADGDHMGEIITAQKTSDQHRNFSRVLATFAGKAQEIVAKYSGALIYAGGDDVLAFVPLHTVIDCARDLASTFVDDTKKAGLKDKSGKHPTFSAGIAIIHHLEPLSDALTLVRQTERVAKGYDGKNALAVSVDMRSGVARTVVGHWDALDTRLKMFATFHRQDAFPDGAAYQLRDTVSSLGGETVLQSNETLRQVARKEGIRILGRKRAQRGTQALSEDTVEQLEGLISNDETSLDQLADELIIARLLSRAADQAYGPLEMAGGE
jgi:CRISPR-associated protein Cmr2